MGFLVPLINILSVFALILPFRQKKVSPGGLFLLNQVLHNPLIIASFLGISWSYLGLAIPELIDRSLAIITGMSLPLALLSIGATFSFKKMRGDMHVALMSTFIKVLLLPLMAGALLLSLGIRGQELGIGVLFAGTPTATAAYIMAQQLKADAELSGTIIMLSTLCSMGTYTIMLYVLHRFGV